MSLIAKRLVQSTLHRITAINVAQPTRLMNRSLIMLSKDGRSSTDSHNIKSSMMCSCGCGGRGLHTAGDKELMNFLDSEISMEKSNMQNTPSNFADFSVKGTFAELTLSKKFHSEQVTVSMNINHATAEEESENIVCKPNFEVDIKVGSKTLSVTCEYIEKGEGEEEESAIFGITELAIFEGEFEDSHYCLSGDIMDPMMYDLLLNMLAERGIDDEFAHKLVDLATSYDHKCYVNVLENLRSFVKEK